MRNSYISHNLNLILFRQNLCLSSKCDFIDYYLHLNHMQLDPEEEFKKFVNIVSLQEEESKIVFKAVKLIEQQDQQQEYLYCHPLTHTDGLLYSLMSNDNKCHHDSEVKLFNCLVEEARNPNQANLALMATAVLTLGQQLVEVSGEHRKQVLHYSKRLQVGPNQYSSERDSLLLCALYNTENGDQLEAFLNSIDTNDTNVVVFINGFLELTNKSIFQPWTFITELASRYQHYSDYAITYQSVKGSKNVLYFITPSRLEYVQQLKWIYRGILKHFDQKYAMVLSTSQQPVKGGLKFLRGLQEQDQNLVGIAGRVAQTKRLRAFSLIEALWLSNQINEVESSIFRSIFQSDVMHNPLNCFYNWQKIKQLMPAYFRCFQNSSLSLAVFNQIQGPSNLLPLQALRMGMKFKQLSNYVLTDYSRPNILELFEHIRRTQNALRFSSSSLRKKPLIRSSSHDLGQISNFLILQGMIIQLTDYFKLSIFVYVIFVSSYQIFSLIDESWDGMVSYVIPFFSIIFLLISAIILALFSTHGYVNVQKVSRSIEMELRIKSAANQNPQITLQTTQSEFKLEPSFSGFELIDFKLIYAPNNQEPYKLASQSVMVLKQELNKLLTKDEIRTLGPDSEYWKQFRTAPLVFARENKTDIALKLKLFAAFGGLLSILILSMLCITFVFNYQMEAQFLIVNCVVVMLLQKGFLALIDYNHYYQYVTGLLSYVFYYFPVNICCDFMKKFHIDTSYENKKQDQFYYTRVMKSSTWLFCNIVVDLILILIEVNTRYSGYFLLAVFSYRGFVSLIQLLCYQGLFFKLGEKQFQEKVSTQENIAPSQKLELTDMTQYIQDFLLTNGNQASSASVYQQNNRPIQQQVGAGQSQQQEMLESRQIVA